MQTSVVHPEFRRMGIYSEFMIGMEQTINFGPGVCLAYFQDEEMKNAYAFRGRQQILTPKMLSASSGFEHFSKALNDDANKQL